MLDLKTIIALASMTYITNLDAYECHQGDEKVFNDFIDECYGFALDISIDRHHPKRPEEDEIVLDES
jgi:hypothetical protein